MGRSTVFVVSDDAAICDSVKELVESTGLQVEIFASLQAFLDAVELGHRGCLVFDAHAGDLSDLEGQVRFVAACARMPVLVITEHSDVPMAVRALKAGAMDVVQKPYRDNNLLNGIQKAVEADAAACG